MAWLVSLLMLAAKVAAFEVTEIMYHASDPARAGHNVTATLWFAKDSTTPAPVVAFAHGFGLAPGAYPLARMLVEQRGFVVLLPHNLGVLPSTVNLALDQVFLLAHAVEESGNPASPLYKRVSNHTVLAGHSLGGGSTLLAADRQLAAAYPSPTAMFTVSLGTYTIPGAAKSAPRIPASMPALLLTATEDCVDPPEKNSIPAYQKMQSDCAFVVSVVGGSHCQYAAKDAGCSLTEKNCGAHPNITREVQWDVAVSVILPFLDAVFQGKSPGPWATFSEVLEKSQSANKVITLAQRSNTCAASDVPSHDVDVLDSDFALECQRKIAHAAKRNVSITLIEANSKTFLTTKPSLQADEARATVNVTMLLHQEVTAPFTHSLAIKMKSGQAITPEQQIDDDVSCADLHNISFTTALAALDPKERQAYGKSTKRLRFGADKQYHTGLYVALARIEVVEEVYPADGITIVAPHFHASTKVPGAWGGVVYCRLLPPRAIRDWIRSQLDHSQTTVAFV